MATWDGGIVKVNGRRRKRKARRRNAYDAGRPIDFAVKHGYSRIYRSGTRAADLVRFAKQRLGIRGKYGWKRNAPLSKTERRALKSILRKHRTRRNPWYLSEKGGTGNRLIRFGPFKTGSPMKLRTTFSRKKYWPTDSQGVWIGRPRKRRSRR